MTSPGPVSSRTSDTGSGGRTREDTALRLRSWMALARHRRPAEGTDFKIAHGGATAEAWPISETLRGPVTAVIIETVSWHSAGWHVRLVIHCTTITSSAFLWAMAPLGS